VAVQFAEAAQFAAMVEQQRTPAAMPGPAHAPAQAAQTFRGPMQRTPAHSAQHLVQQQHRAVVVAEGQVAVAVAVDDPAVAVVGDQAAEHTSNLTAAIEGSGFDRQSGGANQLRRLHFEG
jgi:hypothetical protein